jgi:hypothetical protein
MVDLTTVTTTVTTLVWMMVAIGSVDHGRPVGLVPLLLIRILAGGEVLRLCRAALCSSVQLPAL